MSLTGNLAKIALGIVVAKGVKKMMSGNNNSQASSGGGLGSILGQLGQGSGQSGGLGGILGQLQGGSSSQASSGGLGGLLSGLTGGGAQSGLGGMLGGLLGQGKQSQSSGGIGGMLGGLLGKDQQSQSSGGLGGLLGSLAQGSGGGSGGFGGMLNQAMSSFGEPESKPSDEDEHVSAILLTAMLQAAKADGMVDENEKAAIMEHLKDASADEIAFIQKQFEAPVDPQGLAQSIPRGMEQQAYAMSLLAIDLDSKKEATYLDSFAKALKLDSNTVNSIHAQMDEPALYS